VGPDLANYLITVVAEGIGDAVLGANQESREHYGASGSIMDAFFERLPSPVVAYVRNTLHLSNGASIPDGMTFTRLCDTALEAVDVIFAHLDVAARASLGRSVDPKKRASDKAV